MGGSLPIIPQEVIFKMKKGKRYQEAAKLRDKTNLYEAPEALAIVKKAASAKFDETIEAHLKMSLVLYEITC